MANVILLEDEATLREDVAEFLGIQGHRIDVAASVAEFQRIFKREQHQVAVVDLGLPDGDGLDLIAQIRRDDLRLGVIILTARAGSQARVDGLTGGADYFLSKTIDLAELSATITSLARRLEIDEMPHWLLQCSPRQLVPPGAAPIPLSTQDYIVLRTIAQGGDCGVTRKDIVQALGADYGEYDQRRLHTQMGRLRRKVKHACGVDLPVSTLRAVGFSFHVPVRVTS